MTILLVHMCVIGFVVLALVEKAKDRKNIYMAMALVFFGLTFII